MSELEVWLICLCIYSLLFSVFMGVVAVMDKIMESGRKEQQ